MADSILHRKEGLILTTIDVLDELGIQGLSTREIARREGVSEATLFRHYKSKNDLLLAVLDYYSQYDSDIFKSIQLKNLAPREAIEYWVKAYVEYYENYPAITAITQIYDVLSNDAILAPKIKEIFYSRIHNLAALIDQGKKAGNINLDIDSENLTDVILGYCKQSLLKWRLNRFSYSLKESTLTTVLQILDAFGL